MCMADVRGAVCRGASTVTRTDPGVRATHVCPTVSLVSTRTTPKSSADHGPPSRFSLAGRSLSAVISTTRPVSPDYVLRNRRQRPALLRKREHQMRICTIATLIVVGLAAAAQAQSGGGGGGSGGSGGAGSSGSGAGGASPGGSGPGTTSPGGAISPSVSPSNPAPSTTGSASSQLGTNNQQSGGIPGAVSPANPNAASRPQVPNISGAPIIMNDPNLKPDCSSGSAGGRSGC